MKASMFIGCIYCDWKCCNELSISASICQNWDLDKHPIIELKDEDIIRRYLNNPLTSAIVFGGLEPFMQWGELEQFLECLRNDFNCDDDVVIYTGYTEKEIGAKRNAFLRYRNIVVKYGRFIPNKPSRYDDILGVTLISDNQYGVRY